MRLLRRLGAGLALALAAAPAALGAPVVVEDEVAPGERFGITDLAATAGARGAAAPPASALHVRPAPRVHRVGPWRRRVAYRLRVTNVGAEPTGRVRLCAIAPPRRLRVLGRRCRGFDRVNPGATRKRRFMLRVRPAARGTRSKVTLIARGPDLSRIRQPVRLHVRRR